MSQPDIAATVGSSLGLRDADVPWLTLSEERLLVDSAFAELKAHDLDENLIDEENIADSAAGEEGEAPPVRFQLCLSLPLLLHVVLAPHHSSIRKVTRHIKLLELLMLIKKNSKSERLSAGALPSRSRSSSPFAPLRVSQFNGGIELLFRSTSIIYLLA